MTESEKIEHIRITGGFDAGDDPDEVLSAYLTEAESAIMNRAYPFGYTDETPFPSKYDILSCQIAVYLLNKRGAEGQLTHSENGISRSYSGSNIPADMLTSVVPYCSSIGSAT